MDRDCGVRLTTLALLLTISLPGAVRAEPVSTS